MPDPGTMRPCGMCARLCWQCEQRHDRFKAEWKEQEERVVALELAFAEASDDERDEIADRLQDATEVWWDIGEELDAMEEGDA